uniref:Plexin domain-containing protein 2 n=1 Tax=Ditylenchus dipsaci TaxID=166011 RepID=A0A915CUG8_9BILA
MLDMNATIPPEYSVEDENTDPTMSEHTYYNMTVYGTDENLFDSHYVDMVKWLNQSGVNGSTSHDHLDNSYRKAAAVKFSFEFPFYGHRLNNLTIATGGFIYVGDQTHSWLAATQYIAPLMANFDTMGSNSTIMYGDDGEKMVVEWSKVQLRDSNKGGQFTFQVSMFKNGDIWFVYKDVPRCLPVQPQSTASADKTPPITTQSKRVIHEYHRISIAQDKIASKVVVVLKALPTCLDFKTCQDCSTANLKLFHCSWCDPKGLASDSSQNKAFCSDQIGLNRRRQEHQCEQHCTIPIAASESTPASTAVTPPQHPDKVVALGDKDKGEQKPAESGGNGLAFLSLLFLIAISSVIWILYAFYNPHTTSGQLLIKYRPSKWQIPSSHVRYSASVHM